MSFETTRVQQIENGFPGPVVENGTALFAGEDMVTVKFVDSLEQGTPETEAELGIVKQEAAAAFSQMISRVSRSENFSFAHRKVRLTTIYEGITGYRHENLKKHFELTKQDEEALKKQYLLPSFFDSPALMSMNPVDARTIIEGCYNFDLSRDLDYIKGLHDKNPSSTKFNGSEADYSPSIYGQSLRNIYNWITAHKKLTASGAVGLVTAGYIVGPKLIGRSAEGI